MGTLAVGVCLPVRTGDTHIDVPVQALVHFMHNPVGKGEQ
jgi:hypothetical protein